VAICLRIGQHTEHSGSALDAQSEHSDRFEKAIDDNGNDPMTEVDDERTNLIKEWEAAFRKRVRIVAQNSKGKFSSTWMFWGNRSDYYFGPKAALPALKISLHKNGVGYLAFEKAYHVALKEEAIELPRTSVQWKLPDADGRAVQVAAILLPAKFFSSPASSIETKKTVVLGASDEGAAEISLFYCRDYNDGIDAELRLYGQTMFVTHLDDGRSFVIVAREVSYDPAIIPTTERTNAAKSTLLDKNVLAGSQENYQNLNAMFWDEPKDGGVLRIVDIGGVKFQR
jgi:hypothetical protein